MVASPDMTGPVDAAVARLRTGAKRLAETTPADRIRLIDETAIALAGVAQDWVKVSCEAKRITTPGARSEEILAGPVCTARYLTLLKQALSAISENGKPTLPSAPKTDSRGRLCVPVFPAVGVFDSLLFGGMSAEVRTRPGVQEHQIHGDLIKTVLTPRQPAEIELVLGAGNVSSIPVTDTLTKLFQQNKVVLLKLNPVNDYLKPIFSRLFAALIDAGFLAIILGDSEAGAYACSHDAVESIHITGSHHTHDAIVWGPADLQTQRKHDNAPVLKKQITSELGNVSPWVIFPGEYSKRQLNMQAANIAASLVNNAGFNCLTTRVIVTSIDWPQRTEFLRLVRWHLDQVPKRYAYYPGAVETFAKLTAQEPPADGQLPWVLMENVAADSSSPLFSGERFVCVSAEVPLAGEGAAFLRNAVDFCNHSLFGTLCSAVTVTNVFRRRNASELEQFIHSMNYGVVCVNHWPGLVYGLTTPPWGAAPCSDLKNVQSGIGNVHNLYFIDQIEKTVFRGPLTVFPKPIWFPAHRRSEDVSWKLFDLYQNPTYFKLPGLLLSALRG